MGRRRNPYRLSVELVDAQLERRELMSHTPTVAAAVVHPNTGTGTGGRNLFHQNGVSGLVLHRSFVNQLNDRFTASKAQTTRVTQAFQAFVTSFEKLPVTPPGGPSGPALQSLVATLKPQVATALIRNEPNAPLTPSQQTAIRRSPLAPIALVPFADAQIDKMAATLAQLPPATGPSGKLTQGDPTPAVNHAVNAVLNALAETTVHPLLFKSPNDFYLNPYVTFTLTFSGVPAQSAPGFFIRGPHGTILPGATLHPHAPN
jgi:hypothetical protein